MLALARVCREACPVLLISNATTRLRDDLDALGISGEFDDVINTAEIGYAKPDPRVFLLATARVEVDATEVLFVDDSRGNIEAARSLGIRVHHYSGLEPLQREFKDHHLVPAEA